METPVVLVPSGTRVSFEICLVIAQIFHPKLLISGIIAIVEATDNLNYVLTHVAVVSIR